jgi:hypothetical protein
VACGDAELVDQREQCPGVARLDGPLGASIHPAVEPEAWTRQAAFNHVDELLVDTLSLTWPARHAPEPCGKNSSSTFREGAGGKDPHHGYLAGGLLHSEAAVGKGPGQPGSLQRPALRHAPRVGVREVKIPHGDSTLQPARACTSRDGEPHGTP